MIEYHEQTSCFVMFTLPVISFKSNNTMLHYWFVIKLPFDTDKMTSCSGLNGSTEIISNNLAVRCIWVQLWLSTATEL